MDIRRDTDHPHHPPHHHQQKPAVHPRPERPQALVPAHHQRQAHRPGLLHVPSQLRPHDEPEGLPGGAG